MTCRYWIANDGRVCVWLHAHTHTHAADKGDGHTHSSNATSTTLTRAHFHMSFFFLSRTHFIRKAEKKHSKITLDTECLSRSLLMRQWWRRSSSSVKQQYQSVEEETLTIPTSSNSTGARTFFLLSTFTRRIASWRVFRSICLLPLDCCSFSFSIFDFWAHIKIWNGKHHQTLGVRSFDNVITSFRCLQWQQRQKPQSDAEDAGNKAKIGRLEIIDKLIVGENCMAIGIEKKSKIEPDTSASNGRLSYHTERMGLAHYYDVDQIILGVSWRWAVS